MAAGATESSIGQLLFVDDNAPGCGGNGLTWATAKRFLQDALEHPQLAAGWTIRVAQGTYYPDERCVNGIPTDTNVRGETFTIKRRITVEGGYHGCPTGNCNENPPEQPPETRNIDVFRTILHGDIDHDNPNTVDLAPNPDYHYDLIRGMNAYHVVTYLADPDQPADNLFTTLDGLYVVAGAADQVIDDPPPGAGMGGGILFRPEGTDPSAPYDLGPRVISCRILGNRSYGAGGGIGGTRIGAHMRRCIIKNNWTQGYGIDAGANVGGGGASFAGETFVLETVFQNNLADPIPFSSMAQATGGGLEAQGECTVENSRFIGNESRGAGGGALTVGPHFVNCIFFENSVTGNAIGQTGGGVRSPAALHNCTLCRITPS